VDLEAASISGLHTGERLDQRGFARTVATEERVDLTALNRERHMIERTRPRERFAHIAEPDR
jgi:hypothetical protein